MNYLRFHQNFEDYTGKIDEKERLILASSSVYRKILLSSIRADFECISPNIDETRKSEEKAQEMVII